MHWWSGWRRYHRWRVDAGWQCGGVGGGGTGAGGVTDLGHVGWRAG